MIKNLYNFTSILTGRKILVVDDSPGITALVEEILSDCGAVVTTANSAKDAMFLIQVINFDLILLDVHLPDVDGLDVLKFIRVVNLSLLKRVLLLTGDKYHRIQAALDENLRIIFKPFDVEEIRDAACQALKDAGTLSAA